MIHLKRKESVRFSERFKTALTTLLPGYKSKEFCSSIYHLKKKQQRKRGCDQFYHLASSILLCDIKN